jgi:hypothetical protein
MIGLDHIIMVSDEDIMSSVDFAAKLAASMGSTAAALRIEIEKMAKYWYKPSIIQRRGGVRGRARALKWRRS